MTDALPAPLTPPECDLRGLDWMPLHGHRLFTSELYSLCLSNPRAGMAALKLWWVAWQQCPAASLPNDDRALARFADFGGDMRGWLRVKDLALRGFVLCDDGRLYHKLLGEEAIDAWERRQKATKRQREKRVRDRGAADAPLTRGPRADHARISGGSAADECDQPEADKPLKNNQSDGFVTRDVTVTSQQTGQDRTGQDRIIGGDDSARARARETSKAVPETVPAPPQAPVAQVVKLPVSAAPAVRIIEAFDAARDAAYGLALHRPWPNQLDRVTADRWIAAAAAAGCDLPELLDLCGAVFRDVHGRMAAAGRDPPGSLAFHERDIARALKARAQPMPEVNHVQPHRIPARAAAGGERRTYGGDGSDTIAAVASVLGFGPGMGGLDDAAG